LEGHPKQQILELIHILSPRTLSGSKTAYWEAQKAAYVALAVGGENFQLYKYETSGRTISF
jgi:hypothetical protein